MAFTLLCLKLVQHCQYVLIIIIILCIYIYEYDIACMYVFAEGGRGQHACTHTFIHMYTHTCMHTHTHVGTHTHVQSLQIYIYMVTRSHQMSLNSQLAYCATDSQLGSIWVFLDFCEIKVYKYKH